jgi:hypothetical protein
MITGALVLQIIKAIPALVKLFEEAMDLYMAEQSARDQSQVDATQKKREALVAALKQPGLTNENRSRLRRLLYDLHKL